MTQEPVPCFECSSTYESKEIDGIATLVCPQCGDSVLGADGIEQWERTRTFNHPRLAGSSTPSQHLPLCESLQTLPPRCR